MSERSRQFGPELTFLGSKYDEAPIKIVFLGLNPYPPLLLSRRDRWVQNQVLLRKFVDASTREKGEGRRE